MAVLHSKPSKRGGLRPRLWIDPNPSSADSSLPTPNSSISTGLSTSLAGSSEDTDNATPTSSAELFYVLCLYDYDAEDSDQLSFRRNDILDVVKKEDTVSSREARACHWERSWTDRRCAGLVGGHPSGHQPRRLDPECIRRAHF